MYNLYLVLCFYGSLASVDSTNHVLWSSAVLIENIQVKWNLHCSRSSCITLNKIGQIKTNTVLLHLHVESKKQNTPTKNQTHKYGEETGDCQRGGGLGVDKMGKGHQKELISSYKINESWGYNVQHGDYS